MLGFRIQKRVRMLGLAIPQNLRINICKLHRHNSVYLIIQLLSTNSLKGAYSSSQLVLYLFKRASARSSLPLTRLISARLQ